MAFELISVGNSLIQKHAAHEIMKCNDYTAEYGLCLSETEAQELVETRGYSLKATGRVEFGGGVLDKIIKEFCDSPYISMRNYAQTLHELTEIFYYYKGETLDQISDDDLLKFMHKAFDGSCQGSLALLSGRELAMMARNVRYGLDPNACEDNDLEEDAQDEEDGYGAD
jgi:hypothetical protein